MSGGPGNYPSVYTAACATAILCVSATHTSPEAALSTSAPPEVATTATAHPKVVATTTTPPEIAPSLPELSACSVTATEAIHEHTVPQV